MVVDEVVLHRLVMRMKTPFRTSFGVMEEKEFFVVEVIDEDGHRGFGEAVAFSAPWYTEETVKTSEHIMEDFLIPLLFQSPITHPDEVSQRFSVIRRNNMAKAALEGAVWDLYAKKQHLPLAEVLGGTRKQIDVGISLGIQPTIKELLNIIEESVTEGYKRIKIKIKPGWDVGVIKEVRRNFPDISLMADANSAYTIEDVEHLKKLDEFNLLMIEQPLGHDDIIDHAKLQKELETAICLDESIHSLDDVKMAIELGSCKIINIKVGRVGGLSIAKQIHDYCKIHQVPVWCGGMLDAGIGRAHNIAISTLDHFVLPGDISASQRYWHSDIIEPEISMHNGRIEISINPGIGYDINWKVLKNYRVEKKIFRRS